MYSTDSIILSKLDQGEADALYTLYTRRFGKIRALAIGVKKEAAKLKGHLEPMTRSRVQFILSRAGERLTSAEMCDRFAAIKENWNRMRAAAYILALFDAHCFDGERDELLWQLIISQLEQLKTIPGSSDALTVFLHDFEQKFLERMGYSGGEDIRVLGEGVVRPWGKTRSPPSTVVS